MVLDNGEEWGSIEDKRRVELTCGGPWMMYYTHFIAHVHSTFVLYRISWASKLYNLLTEFTVLNLVVFYIFRGIKEYHYLVWPWLLYNYDSKRKIQSNF